MPNYENLIARLREAAERRSNSINTRDTCREAADAIEVLQTYKVCFDSIRSMGGWWLVGQDKNLYRMDVPMNWPPKGTKAGELFPPPGLPKEG